ncbi:MAG TPA: 4-hydroxythreonine-4-phosphate dehydrogenase PdxA [Lacipirellulaceae bacterium]|nr:4-hydroxythreonine-4-phosphate dehydrogenase PdxA [Lacipirellulaceae bacterium]
MSAPAKPILAVTMGDPAGIGPEVIVGAWNDSRIHEQAQPFVVGHAEILRRAVRMLGCDLTVVEIESPESLRQARSTADTLPCIKACSDEVLDVPPGQVDARAGEAAYQAVRASAEMALAKQVDGIVTAPLSKAALHAAGHHYPGHTELLAEICGAREFAMMLYLGGEWGAGSGEQGAGSGEQGAGSKQLDIAGAERDVLRTEYSVLSTASSHPAPGIPRPASSVGLGVVHVTLHQALRSVFADLTPDAIESKCRLADSAMRRLGVTEPRIGVCALNPHAGEDGLFGDEEQTVIRPAVEAARRAGLKVSGPFPADTLMMRARDGEFDAVVAMYHDQGHIALKLLGMHSAVNITLGLPIVRTSVAHGTAFDRAWQGTARGEGMVAAIGTAARLTKSLP